MFIVLGDDRCLSGLRCRHILHGGQSDLHRSVESSPSSICVLCSVRRDDIPVDGSRNINFMRWCVKPPAAVAIVFVCVCVVLFNNAACSNTCSSCLATTGACLGCVAGTYLTADSLTCTGPSSHRLLVDELTDSVQGVAR